MDDINYLIDNAEKDSQIVYLDSSLRNKLFYPNPNEYTIEFDQPFKLVYGFDIVDSAVPVTMYNVDLYNNQFSFSVIKTSETTPVDRETYAKQLSTVYSFTEMYNRNAETFIIVGEESNLSSYLPASTTIPNYVLYFRSEIVTSEVLKKTSQSSSEFYFFTSNSVEYCIKDTVNNQGLIDIVSSGEFHLEFGLTSTIYHFEKHLINKAIFEDIEQSGAFSISVSNYTKTLEAGNYDILTIMSDMSIILNPLGVSIEPTTSPPEKQSKIYFSSPHLILLNGSKGDLIKSLGFDTYPSATTDGNYKGWNIGSNFYVFGAIYDTISSTYKIFSPGLVGLLGERFAILRIAEIEDHLSGSFSYMRMTPGVGMFKMAATHGQISNLRFDFTTIIRKPFHPIGKLSKLSIRFETAAGYLYDFKGMNHQLLVNIKFYVPTQKLTFSKSILNPNYDPNFMEYMAVNRGIQNHEDSDDEQTFDDEKFYETYKKEVDKYDYSSSNDGDDEDDDDSDDDSEEEI